MKLKVGISTCPNDTFIFGPIVMGFVREEELEFEFVMDDIEALNHQVLEGVLDVSKISIALYPEVVESYELLSSGGAFSYEGPVVVSRDPVEIGSGLSVALPGRFTTAHLLFSVFHPDVKRKVFARFDKIPRMVMDGEVDLGVLIHEGRFVCESMGLSVVEDLGKMWTESKGLPIPLGGMAVKRSLQNLKEKLENVIKRSILFSKENYEKIYPFIKHHAQEMSDDVISKHIKAYVNRWTFEVGDECKKAVEELILYKERLAW